MTGQASLTFINAQIEESQADVEYPSEYDLNYFIKGSLKYQFNRQWIITTTFLFREGQYYQPLVGSHYDEALEVFEPEYMPLAHQERLPVYNIIDLSLSRLIPLNEDLTIIAFGSVNNILNRKNIREYSYNFNYTERADELFSQRAIYFGAIINF